MGGAARLPYGASCGGPTDPEGVYVVNLCSDSLSDPLESRWGLSELAWPLQTKNVIFLEIAPDGGKREDHLHAGLGARRPSNYVQLL
jgi:hypothetical protein